MPKRLTPIERAIAGQPPSRQRRYDASLPSKGLKRMTVVVPVADVERVRKFAADLRRTAATPDRSAGGVHD